MKINSEMRLMLILGAIVLLGGGGMVAVNRLDITPKAPPAEPTPVPLAWDTASFQSVLAKARHVRGDKKARFSLIEFGDLECPSCRYAYNHYLTKIEKQMPIQWAFIHFPLQQHQQALSAAVATEAAARQNKFWQMFDGLYDGTDTPLNPVLCGKVASQIGLNLQEFSADCSDVKLNALITADQQVGINAHVSQTPTFLLRDATTGQVYFIVGSKDLDTRISALTNTPRVMPPDPAK